MVADRPKNSMRLSNFTGEEDHLIPVTTLSIVRTNNMDNVKERNLPTLLRFHPTSTTNLDVIIINKIINMRENLFYLKTPPSFMKNDDP